MILSILAEIFRSRRTGGFWWRDEQKMFIPRKIEPTVTASSCNMKRRNKMYTPGRRVRGDVAI